VYLENVEETLLFIDLVEVVAPLFPIPFRVFHGGRTAQRIKVGIEFVEGIGNGVGYGRKWKRAWRE